MTKPCVCLTCFARVEAALPSQYPRSFIWQIPASNCVQTLSLKRVDQWGFFIVVTLEVAISRLDAEQYSTPEV